MITPEIILNGTLENNVKVKSCYYFFSNFKFKKGYELWTFLPKTFYTKGYPLFILLDRRNPKTNIKWIPDSIDNARITKMQYIRKGDYFRVHCETKRYERGFKYDYKLDTVFTEKYMEKIYEKEKSEKGQD